MNPALTGDTSALPTIDPELLKKATPEELAHYQALLEAQLALESPADYADFATGKLSPNLPYLRPKHIDVLNETIVRLIEHKLIKKDGVPYHKLLITMPPRHGKSELTSKYTPAWFLSKYPDRRVIDISYGSSLAKEAGEFARDLMLQLGGAFGLKVSPSSRSVENWKLQSHQGSMKSVGVTGSITGKGAHLLIIDDPISNSEAADSETQRENAWNLYASTSLTRLEPGGVIVVIQTRWHHDDLAGRLLRHEPDEWFHVNLPALAGEDDPLGRQPGEALWPERYNEEALALVRNTDPRWWAALYQQTPQIGDTAVFSRENYRYWSSITSGRERFYRLYQPDGTYVDLPETKCWRFQTVDLAISEKTTADYTVISTWAVTEAKDLLLIDRFRKRIDGTKHEAEIARAIAQHNPRFTGIEKQTFGAAVIQTMLRKGHRIRELTADKDKVTRAWQAASLVNAGRSYFPRSAPWLTEWESELDEFPYGTHDDQVDTFGYAGWVMAQHERRPIKPKAQDAETYDEKVWRYIRGRKKQKRVHPELGSY